MSVKKYYIINLLSSAGKGVFKRDEAVLLQTESGSSKAPKGEDLYAGFNPATMKLIENKGKELPDYFKLDQKGNVIGLKPGELEKLGLTLTSIPETAPPIGLFDDIRNGEIVGKMVEHVVKDVKKLNLSECEDLLRSLIRRLEREIAEDYPPGHEMKLTKAYLAWLNEDKPKNDPREQAYLEMEAFIAKITAKYKPMRSAVKKQMDSFLKKESVKPGAIPDRSQSKTEIQAYLKKKKIPFNAKDTKQQLLDKIKSS